MNRASSSMALTGLALLLTASSSSAQIGQRGVLGGHSLQDGPQVQVIEPGAETPHDPRAPHAPSAGTSGGITAPEATQGSSYQGTFTHFGKLVDRSGDKLIIADDKYVYIYDESSGTFDTTDLLSAAISPQAVPVVEILDLAIDGTSAAVIWNSATKMFAVEFRLIGGSWVQGTALTTAMPVATGSIALHGEHLITLFKEAGGPGISTLILFNIVTFGSGFSSSVPGLAVGLAAGDGPVPGSPTSILVAADDFAGTRNVSAFTVTPSNVLTAHGVVESRPSDTGFGDAMAIDAGWAFIGSPTEDIFAIDGGTVRYWRDNGAGSFTYGSGWASAQPSDRWGRALAMDDELAAFSEIHADLVPGSDFAGAVRLMRRNAGNTGWDLTGEIHHTHDQEFLPGNNFGASLAVDDNELFVGEPATVNTPGKITWNSLAATSVLEWNVVPGIAGFGGNVPFTRPFGSTIAGAPFLIQAGLARPSSLAFMLLGFSSVSSPLKGGILYPNPDIILTIPTSGSGGLFVTFPWDDYTPFTLYGQYWIQDVDAPVGWAASGGFSIRQD